VLQEGEIRRVGDQKVRRVDVRILAATARDLVEETRTGRFREDLFYRLNVVTIYLPALARRPEDIAPLARHFAAQLEQRLGRRLELSGAAVSWLEGQRWPGNVRELAHAIERAAVLTEKDVLEPVDFTSGQGSGVNLTPGAGPGTGDERVTLREAVDQAERRAIAAALQAAGGNRRHAAKRLGVSLRTLFYKMEKLGIN
jgi:two-component system response regulator HydG